MHRTSFGINLTITSIYNTSINELVYFNNRHNNCPISLTHIIQTKKKKKELMIHFNANII